ncbi:MAG: chalcone isomerase family protein [bacterium]|nr:chalcone isomerase family protein [bacterium]
MRKILFAVLLMMMPAFAAHAEKPAEVAPFIKAEQPYGAASLSKLMFHVYDATLWTDADPWSMGKPFALRLKYGMDFKGKNLAERSVDEMNDQSQLTPGQEKGYYKQLAILFPDVKKGDTITAIYLPAKGTRLYHNGAYKGSITDTAFSKRFIGIWMSEKTSEPKMRKQLITKTGE